MIWFFKLYDRLGVDINILIFFVQCVCVIFKQNIR